MIDQLISELVAYGLENGLIDDADKVYVTNGLLELFQRQLGNMFLILMEFIKQSL